MLPVDPNFRTNIRVDGYADFAELKAKGQVRSKQGGIIDIDEPHNKWSARQRDELYQAYCVMMTETFPEPSARLIRDWIDVRAAELNMSPARAIDIINEGNGQYAEGNMRWWRGVSLP